MLYATNIFPGDNTTTQFELTFVGGYLDRDHVVAYYEDNLSKVQTPIDMGTVTWLGPYTAKVATPAVVGQNLVFARKTPREGLVDFQGSSRITEANLDLAHRQGLFVAVEALDNSNTEAMNYLRSIAASVTVSAEEALVSGAEAAAYATLAANHATSAAGHSADAANYAVSAGDARDIADAYRVAAGNAVPVAQAAAANAEAARNAVLANVGIASSAATASATSATQAEASAILASESATLAVALSEDSAESAAQAAGIRDALAGGSLGFPAVAYDWGSVADPSTYFNRDFGSIA